MSGSRWLLGGLALGLLTGCGGHAAPAAKPATVQQPGAAATSRSASPSAAPRPPLTQAARPLSVSAVSSDRVWVLARSACAVAPCRLVLFASANGGRSWRKVGLPSRPVGSRGLGIGSVEFANRHDGWLLGRRLWATSDSGRHWRAVPLPGRVQGVQVAGNSVFVIAGRCGAGRGCQSYTLLRGDVSSSRLAVQQLPLPLSHKGAVPWLGARGNTVAVLNNQKPSAQHDGDRVELSFDEGRTWSVRPGPCIRELGGQVAPAGDAIWAACPTGMMAQVVRSTGGAFHGDLVGPNSASVTPLGADSAVSSLFDRRVFWTDDGGSHWHRSHLPSLPRSGILGSLSFPDAMHGYALYEGPRTTVMLTTNDGGRRWRKLRHPVGVGGVGP
jgi:hypothetical protein